MNKEDLKKQLETIKGLGNSPIAFECLLGTVASINYQLTEGVKQLKALVDQGYEEDRVEIREIDDDDFDAYGSQSDTPHACGLRTAVEDIAKAVFLGGAPYTLDYILEQQGDKDIGISPILLKALFDALDAHTCKPVYDEANRYKSCGCIICICEDTEQCQGCGATRCGKDDCALMTRKPAPDASELAKAVEILINQMSGHKQMAYFTIAKDRVAVLQSALDKYRKEGR